MRAILIIAAALATGACGLNPTDRNALTDEELRARAPLWEVDFGDDSGDWANDGECDDPRFRGPGMTAVPVIEEDEFGDASDCRSAYKRGELALVG